MIDVFSVSEFEAALPVHKQTGEKLWKPVGFVDGEYAYKIQITPDVFISIRSSIKEDGLSAGTGQDSIRAWLTGADGKPLGSKVQKWVTREPGWQDRLVDMLRELWDRARKAGYCKKCKTPNGVYRVKQGKNKGRLFKKCPNCGGGFEWMS